MEFGRIYQKKGDIDKARASFQTAYNCYQKCYGEEHADTKEAKARAEQI